MRGVKLIFFCAVAVVFLLHVDASASDPKLKKLDPAKVESIRTALENDISKDGRRLPLWFDTVSVCGPQLWRKVSVSLDRSGIEVMPTKFGNADGAVFKGALGNQRLAVVVLPLVAGGKVRLLTNEEMRQYWNFFPFDEIEEPVFMVSSQKADLLIHLQYDQDKRRYFVFLIEAFRLQEAQTKPS